MKAEYVSSLQDSDRSRCTEGSALGLVGLIRIREPPGPRGFRETAGALRSNPLLCRRSVQARPFRTLDHAYLRSSDGVSR